MRLRQRRRDTGIARRTPFDELHEAHEAFFDEPVDLGIGMAASDVGDHRHVVNDVAQ